MAFIDPEESEFDDEQRNRHVRGVLEMLSAEELVEWAKDEDFARSFGSASDINVNEPEEFRRQLAEYLGIGVKLDEDGREVPIHIESRLAKRGQIEFLQAHDDLLDVAIEEDEESENEDPMHPEETNEEFWSHEDPDKW